MRWFNSIVYGSDCNRLKPGREAKIDEIEAEFQCKLSEVGWLPSFYSLPTHVQIANSKAYQEGKVNRGRNSSTLSGYGWFFNSIFS